MYKKKLIEVALPLDDINREAAREKSIRHGHPSTLHLWWARRPLAACRAVLFASLVDDPSAHPDRFPTEEDQVIERERLFDIIRDLVKWENSNNETVLAAARAEIWASCDGNPPPVLDPFAGGGSIPLEAQRLGLEAHASDLNPVAVLINKALVEIPPRFADQPPIHPDQQGVAELKTWTGAQGLAEDVRYYGRWMRDEAQRRIGHLYPKVKLPKEQGGGEATVIAWIWARTVQCPNPACGATTPLASTYVLSSKPGKRRWVVPTVEDGEVSFSIGGPDGESPAPPKRPGRGSDFGCVICGQAVDGVYIRAEGMAGRLGVKLLAVVAEGKRRRIYVPPSTDQEAASQDAHPTWAPSGPVPERLTGGTCYGYGLTDWGKLFTGRQLVALTTFSDLVAEARDRIRDDATAAGLPDDPTPLRDAGTGATAYAEAVSVYLAFAVSRTAEFLCSIATWSSNRQNELVRGAFSRQAIPMTWDYAEANPFAGSSGDVAAMAERVSKVLDRLVLIGRSSRSRQLDAVAIPGQPVMVSTDPPYYDNIGYADLSDFFYVWLRRSLSAVYPEEFSTLLVPKSQELIATPYRFDGDRKKAEGFFESGLGKVFERLHATQDPRFPLTVYYAFKQAESTVDGVASTGWETMLQSLIDAGFLIDGTWPMRSERGGRMISIGTNALASSIVLVCRHRPDTAPLATRRELVAALKADLPDAVRTLQHENIAPVDLAQASLGPGMAVFSRYSKVVEADGSAMRVRTALELINQVLDETVAGSDADFDHDTRWATTWFEEFGMTDGIAGRAEQLTKSRNTSIEGLDTAGIITQGRGKVQLKARDQLDADWDPSADRRLTVWEVTQHLIRRLDVAGERPAAELLHQVGSGLGEAAKELAYRLYLVCDRKGWAKEALAYNTLVTAWPELLRLQKSAGSTVRNEQDSML